MGHINGIKVDFVRHNYPWIVPPQRIDGITMASLPDIAAMKLNAIVGNGSRLKDFVDIAFFYRLICPYRKCSVVTKRNTLTSMV